MWTLLCQTTLSLSSCSLSPLSCAVSLSISLSLLRVASILILSLMQYLRFFVCMIIFKFFYSLYWNYHKYIIVTSKSFSFSSCSSCVLHSSKYSNQHGRLLLLSVFCFCQIETVTFNIYFMDLFIYISLILIHSTIAILIYL